MSRLHMALFGLLSVSLFAADLKPGLVGEYFNISGKSLKGDAVPEGLKPFFVKTDKHVHFGGVDGPFNGSKLVDSFLVRWQGVLTIAAAGDYSFFTRSDDGSRLYIGNKQVVDNWGLHGMEEKSGSIRLTAGAHDIRIMFHEAGGGAGCEVKWQAPGAKKEALPAAVLGHRSDQEVSFDKTAWSKLKTPKAARAQKTPGSTYNLAKHGPFQGTAVGLGEAAGQAKFNWQEAETQNLVYRGIVIPLSEEAEAAVVFDADTMRMAAGWTEGGLILRGLPYDGAHAPYPGHVGERLWTMPAQPGWAKGSAITDPREGAYPPLGPLPKDWAHYKGLYRHGDKVVLSYTVGEAKVLEGVSLEGSAIARTFEIDNNPGLTLVLAEAPEGSKVIGPLAATLGSENPVLVSALKAPANSAFEIRDGLLTFRIGAADSCLFKISFSRGGKTQPMAPQPLKPYTEPGPRIWPEVASTKGELGSDDKPYTIDRVTLPFTNPWDTRVRIGGMDFFADGSSAAVSTWDGDVFIVRGIDDKMENLTWQRFASGGHETLGLKIVNDVIYTVADDQITRYHDTNGDGEADFYENFNNDWDLTTGFHAFCFDLHTDMAGNFYFAFGGPVRNGGGSFMRVGLHHGSVIKVSKDGSRMTRYASGFRAPNGMGVGPDGQVTTGDNEGTFVPRSPLNWVKEGGFYGVVDTAEDRQQYKTTATVKELTGGRSKQLDISEMPKPLCWFPKDIDNSGGGQVWVTSDRWGPFGGELLHMSYGKSALYLVMKEEKNGQMQGGVTRFPVKFTSSAMRARVNPRDGQLYVAGLKGWQSNAGRPGGFDRVRYTGKPVAMPKGLKATPTGIDISFTAKLDPELANDPESFSVRAADIKWTHGYGSAEYQIGQRDGKPAKGWSTMDVIAAKLQDDGKTVSLTIKDMQPVHEMEISIDLETVDGEEIITKIHNTVHKL
jgi:hypothetical protein